MSSLPSCDARLRRPRPPGTDFASGAGNFFLKAGLALTPSIAPADGSAEQLTGLLAQPLEHPTLGDKDGVHGGPQLGGDVRGGPPLADRLLEGVPGRPLELQADQVEEAAGDVAVVLLVPGAAQGALGVLE